MLVQWCYKHVLNCLTGAAGVLQAGGCSCRPLQKTVTCCLASSATTLPARSKKVLDMTDPPAPSRVDQHVAIGMATERSATTRLKDSPSSAVMKSLFGKATPAPKDLTRMWSAVANKRVLSLLRCLALCRGAQWVPAQR